MARHVIEKYVNLGGTKTHWKFQLGEANIARDIAKTKWQLEVRLRSQTIISQVLNRLRRPATIGVFKFSITLFNLLQLQTAVRSAKFTTSVQTKSTDESTLAAEYILGIILTVVWSDWRQARIKAD